MVSNKKLLKDITKTLKKLKKLEKAENSVKSKFVIETGNIGNHSCCGKLEDGTDCKCEASYKHTLNVFGVKRVKYFCEKCNSVFLLKAALDTLNDLEGDNDDSTTDNKDA